MVCPVMVASLSEWVPLGVYRTRALSPSEMTPSTSKRMSGKAVTKRW